MHKNMYDILQEHGLSIDQEYKRLYELYHENNSLLVMSKPCSVRAFVEAHFRRFDKRLIRRCLSLEDFNKTHGFYFPAISAHFHDLPLEKLISFMEYLYNLLIQIQAVCTEIGGHYLQGGNRHLNFMASCIESLADDLGCTKVVKEGVFIFVNTTPEVTMVAESLEDDMAIKVFEYNHRRLKGNLDEKLSILKSLADNIEPHRRMLEGLHKAWTTNLFQMLQKFVRHNNDDNPVISAMDDEQLEQWYDEIYRMWLLAKLMLENASRAKEVSVLLGKINEGKS